MTQTIEGTVSDDEGDGIEGATITVADAATEELEATTTTDETGEYSVSVAPDTYDVRAERIGFAADEERVTVGPDVTKTVDLTLVELSADVVGEITDGPGIGVLGTVRDDNGASIGIQGEVASNTGYGLYTPNDVRIDGIVDTSEEWQIAVDRERGLRLAAPEEVEIGSTDYTGSGSVVVGHLNDVDSGVAGAVISGGGRYDHDDDERRGNRVTNHFGTISGGVDNLAGGDDPRSSGATVGGGSHNEASGNRTTVGGGHDNEASNFYATVSGGVRNKASGNRTTVGGGSSNTASDSGSTVSGGLGNTAIDRRATIGGGSHNEASDSEATVGGGYDNEASGNRSTVAGGVRNEASDKYATVDGGQGNTASGPWSMVGGGQANTASANLSTVGGGRFNTAAANLSMVGGGGSNAAGGAFGTVPGGAGNAALGDYSFAAGRGARAEHDGAFVFGDSSNAAISSNAPDEARFQMEAYAPSFNRTSARSAKMNVEPVDPLVALEGVESLEVSTWEFREGDAGRHMGPMAGEFAETFGLGDGDSIATVDSDGVALAAIQGLAHKLNEKDERIADLEERLFALESQVGSDTTALTDD